MPILSPPITGDIQEDSWKNQATEIIRILEKQIEDLENNIVLLEARVKALE